MRVALAALVLLAFQAPERSTTALSRAAAQRDAARYDVLFKKYTKRYFGVGFDWHHFKAQAMAESDLNPDATSPVGAKGLMQLMPSTFQAIATTRPDFASIDDPEWNIAAGILHDRDLWRMWSVVPDTERTRFMFGTYNAGEGPITRASAAAKAQNLEPTQWTSIEQVAPNITRWRYRETLGYVRRIEGNFLRMTQP
jgi:membrane-bound lytic murein transglycosylase F